MQLIFDQVSFTYDSRLPDRNKALDDVSFTINDGDFFGITGKTGSGKSTLLKLMNGLLKPQEGTILLDGTDISSKTISPVKLRSMVGLVFQYPEYQLFESTVLKDVMFGPLNIGLSESEAMNNARKALSMMGLDGSFHHRNPDHLSGGEKRRVAIAGIIAMDPSVIILDEPAAGLDPEGHDRLFRILSDLNRSGKTIVIVSHDMKDVSTYCNRALVLADGQIQACSETSSLSFKDPQVLEVVTALQKNGVFVSSDIRTHKDLLECLKILLKHD